MEPDDIWRLILKADERLKYATGTGDPRRREQAAALLQEALSEAEAAGEDVLAGHARTRLADLDSRSKPEGPEQGG